MRQNGEVREQLDQTKARNQDAILILQYQMKRDVGLTEEALENVVKSMYAKSRVPGNKIIKGFIMFAKSAAREWLERMVDFPFEVPSWFFRELVPVFFKLSGRSRIRSRFLTSTLLKHTHV
jgi:hypothetical protein